MKIETIFERIGLPKHSSTIYALLQRRGPMLATQICTRAKLHRPAVYSALSSLLAHKFVFTTTQGARKKYHAAHPKRVTDAFTRASTKVSSLMAQQKLLDEIYTEKEIRMLSGFQGIRAAFDDVIAHTPRGETFYRYTSEKDLDAVNKYLSSQYRNLRDKKKLERMVISNPISGRRKKPRLERFVKYIPSQASLFDQNIIQLVYGKRISLIDLNTERVLIIENEALADFQKVIFRQLYDKLPLL